VRTAPTVGLIGIYGHGAVHLRELERLSAAGRARVVACADVRAPAGEQAAVLGRLGCRYFGDWQEMLRAAPAVAGPLDMVVIASPPQLHTDMAVAAMQAGAHVLLEKPPVVTHRDFGQLLAAMASTGVACQVGFQSTGSGALGRVRQLLAKAELGGSCLFGVTGRWQRDRAYWTRAEWAGRAVLRGVQVRDGALSNPFAHASMNCLLAAGAVKPGSQLAGVEVERYRANAIEVEDTGCVRVSLVGGATFVVAVTLCAEVVQRPVLSVWGAEGQAGWPYEGDTVSIERGQRSWTESFARRSLAEELLDFIAGRSSRLSCPLEHCGTFVELLEAVHAAPVYGVPGRWVSRAGAGDAERPVLAGVDAAVDAAVREGRLFSELGVPWAVAAQDQVRTAEK
jgi:predicted dehydrogenase